MKSFVAAILLFIFLTGVAFWASASLTEKADALALTAESLFSAAREKRSEGQQKIAKLWKKEKFLFSLTVNRNEIDVLDKAISRLEAAANAKDDDEFLIAVSELNAAISRIRDMCAFSLDNIL